MYFPLHPNNEILAYEKNRKLLLVSLQSQLVGKSEPINKWKDKNKIKMHELCQGLILPPQHVSLPSAVQLLVIMMHFLFHKTLHFFCFLPCCFSLAHLLFLLKFRLSVNISSIIQNTYVDIKEKRQLKCEILVFLFLEYFRLNPFEKSQHFHYVENSIGNMSLSISGITLSMLIADSFVKKMWGGYF